MARHDMILPFFKWRFDTDDRRMMEKNLTEKINYLTKSSEQEIESLKKKVKTYTGMLSANGVRDENLARKLDWGWLRYFTLIAGFPLFIAGYLSNLIPFIVPRSFTKKFIKDSRFTTGFYVITGTVLYLIYFPLVLILAAVFAGWNGFLVGLLVPVAGYLVIYYQEIFRERLNTLRFSIKSVTNKLLITDLRNQRKDIQMILDNIKVV